MVEAHATAKYIRTSAQKAGLVMDLIRGRDVNQALATLKFARKSVAHDIEKVGEKLRAMMPWSQEGQGREPAAPPRERPAVRRHPAPLPG